MRHIFSGVLDILADGTIMVGDIDITREIQGPPLEGSKVRITVELIR